ncbi:DUF2062 domain-containing protein [Brevibacillus fluminis]|uniref:DUF2062 domain-containing protein n=1 Tax=Brevibacillus fluminis TaxID=511487 RepID=A0A3M8DK88_9BACL|nr:DUF2062 domain-containing protein [Brevibacillus fluminis]RNB87815.1 DUF2062 domain-containing protein [Brevibacillus fluminis]
MWRKLYRKFKFEYYKLMRMKGAASIVARGFALGIAIEFITLPTIGLVFLLLYPLNVLFRGSFSAALIGFVIGKLVLPIFMIPNMKLGSYILGQSASNHVDHGGAGFWAFIAWMKKYGLAYFTGSAVMGIFAAIVSYFLVYAGLQLYRKRKARRRSASVG